MRAIDEIVARQAEWSSTANKLKASLHGGRWVNFGLTIMAALLAAIASQFDSTLRLTLAILSAAMFGVVTLLTARLVTAANAQEWVRARAASEALKRLAFTYGASAAPYNDPATRDAKLLADAKHIQGQVNDLLAKRVTGPPNASLAEPLTPAAYVDRRVDAAAKWYARKADEHSAAVAKLRRAEFVLALATAVITAAAGVLAKDVARGAGTFDFVALTAVLTTISGAILAHVEASRYDFIIVAYRATAMLLRDALAGDPAQLDPASTAWSDFVRTCEELIAAENGSWVMKMGKT